MERHEVLAKLNALYNAVSERLKNPRHRYFDPPPTLEFFERYAPLRDELRSQLPSLLGDLPVRALPKPTNTTDHDGRGYITREPLEQLLGDMKYIRDVVAATPVVDVPSMKVTREGVFFAGQYFDALRQVAELVRSAKASLVLIDGYIGTETLDLLSGKAASVSVRILTKELPSHLKIVAEAFQKQHGRLEIRSSQAFHDRFLVIDDTEFYHFGASIKDLGRRGFMFSVIEEPDVVAGVRRKFQQEWTAAKVLL